MARSIESLSRLGHTALPLCLSLLAACNRPPSAGDSDEFGTSGEVPEDADIDASCGDGIAQEGEFCLYLASNPDAGIDPCDLDTADFNHDGLPDLAVPNSDPNISNNAYVANVMLGDGQQIAAARAHAAGGAVPVRSAAGDFNGDGHPDFAVANYTEQAVNILLGDGEGNFSRADQVNCGSITGDLAGADLDGDGRDELIVAYPAESRIDIFFAAGLAGRETINLTAPSLDVEAADFDGDGLAEVIAPVDETQTDSFIQVFSRFGAGNYVQRWVVPTMESTSSVKAGDLDADGDLDLVAVSTFGELGIHEFQGGNLSAAHTQYLGGSFRDLAIADFDSMARQDLAITDTDSNHVRFFRLGADDHYHQFAERFTGSYPVAVVTADFNQDGHPDLATADQFSNRLSMFISAP